MIFSGTDLIKASGHNAERAQRLQDKEQSTIRPVENPAQSQSSLDEQTQGALLRFARFVNKEGQKKQQPKSNKKAASGLPKAYQTQVANVNQDERSGGMINIFI